MPNRDVLSILDLSRADVRRVFERAAEMKAERSSQTSAQAGRPLAGKSVAMIFEKPSLRTRVTFEVAISELGGHPIYLSSQDIQMGKREPVADVAMNLERWVHGIIARTFSHETLVELAEHASVPVINALSDREHPCQALADVFTIQERKGNLRGLRLAYVGDGCNTCHSLMLLCPKVGMNVAVAAPKGYEPAAGIVAAARSEAAQAGTVVEVSDDPKQAVSQADVVYTDVWASMGLEQEREKRLKVFPPYQVNAELLRHAKPDAIVMHCLPAHCGEEIAADVLYGPQSAVLDEAENRLHAQKGLLSFIYGQGD